MVRMSEAKCKEMIRGATSQMLYLYPEYEKLYPVVILDTTAGDMTLEMHLEESPRTCHNFLEHCRNGYFEPCLFNRIQKIEGFMGPMRRPNIDRARRGIDLWRRPTFDDEYSFTLKHDRAGVVSMCNKRKPHTNGSQFFITLSPCPWLDGKNVIFAQVVKGLDVLKKMNMLPVNKYDRPLDYVFLTRTLVIERPRHYEWRPHAESYGCFNSKGSQLRLSKWVDKAKPPRGNWRVIKRVSAKFVKPTHQGGWELWHKRAF